MARHLHDAPSAISLIPASSAWGVATVSSRSLLSSVSPSTLLMIQLVPSVASPRLLTLIQRLSDRRWRT